jgi:hypothetical protein
MQVPLHELYFDLTPIEVTHTKTYYCSIYALLYKITNNSLSNLLHILLLVPGE